MKLSARNQFPGVVCKITEGAVNGIVVIDVNGTPVSATISMNAIKELGLEVGKKACAVIKATEVMLCSCNNDPMLVKTTNGKVLGVEKGAVNSIVKMEVLGGLTLSSTISNSAVEELGLEAGKEALAVIKATSVMVGVEE